MSLTSARTNLQHSATAVCFYRSMAIPAGLAILACGVLIGCGGSSGSAPPSPKGISVSVAPSSFTMGVGSNYQFVATVTGTSNTAVQWQVNGMGGGAASAGRIDNAGLY